MLYVLIRAWADQLDEDFITTCSYFLPKWRLDQMMSYHLQSDRKLCSLAYLMMVYALKNEGLFNDLPNFGYHAEGKPFLSNYPDIYFSLSYCSGVVACLLSDSEVGVDVEKICQYDDGLAQAVCNDTEYL